jgi:hypothetical protein
MSQNGMAAQHPYEHLVQTTEWSVIDRAIRELAENHDLVETTNHVHIVGYLCRALKATSMPEPQADTRAARETQSSALQQLREAIKIANPHNRDLVAELIAERRMEAERE